MVGLAGAVDTTELAVAAAARQGGGFRLEVDRVPVVEAHAHPPRMIPNSEPCAQYYILPPNSPGKSSCGGLL